MSTSQESISTYCPGYESSISMKPVLRRSERLTQKLKNSEDVFEKCNTEPIPLNQEKFSLKSQGKLTEQSVALRRSTRRTRTNETTSLDNEDKFNCKRNPKGRPSKYLYDLPKIQCYNDNALIRSPFFNLNMGEQQLQQQQHLQLLPHSILPPLYPTHFKRQLSQHQQQNPIVPTDLLNTLTPDVSVEYDVDAPPILSMSSTASSPSLPASLKGAFETDNLRELLHVDRVEYCLTDRHVQALALILNTDVRRLREIINKVLTLPEQLLQKMNNYCQSHEKALAGNGDVVAEIDNDNVSNKSESVIGESPSHQSTETQRHFSSQTKGTRVSRSQN